MEPDPKSSSTARLIVVGKNSKIWRHLAGRRMTTDMPLVALGHNDIADFSFSPNDLAWILSYSKRDAANDLLFRRLHSAGLRRMVYVSTATTNVVTNTRCYSYPTAKAAAEASARAQFDTVIARIGIMYDDASELPRGPVVATSYEELEKFITSFKFEEHAEQGEALVFEVLELPFASSVEKSLFRCYSYVQRRTGSYPCILRPLDLILKLLGYRWYGYVGLSNRLWATQGISPTAP